MAHMLDALDNGGDIGHYERLVFPDDRPSLRLKRRTSGGC